MRKAMLVLFMGAIGCAAVAWGQHAGREPHIGYLYPAGGQAGTSFEIIAGGQNFRGAKGDVLVSGEGVQATAVEFYRPLRNLNGDQRRELQRRMKAARNRRLAEQSGRETAGLYASKAGNKPVSTSDSSKDAAPVKLPRHPLLDGVDDMSLRELEHLQHMLRNFRKRQLNPQIAETVRIEVTIDPNAPFGPRELRLKTGGGISNPMCFHVDGLPEVRELEPNGPQANSKLRKPEPLELPILLNGQIMPGDVDRFAFRAKQGQKLVVKAHARSLVPYLADAVPGWFQAVLALYDAEGYEIAFADDFRFDPDPVLLYEILKEGVYELEIRDSIFRGREDFVYRVSIGEHPFITDMFPLGGRAGEKTVAAIDGWNLPEKRLLLNTDYGVGSVRTLSLTNRGSVSNRVKYAVSTLTESFEKEPNNEVDAAQMLELPCIVNGRINAPGDVDVFAIEGRAGETIVVEVQGRRLRSPIDSLVRVWGPDGEVVEWNDDFGDNAGHLHRLGGLLTHDADSYLEARLSTDGVYHVQVLDAQGHGGDAYGYRLRLSSPQPDFALRVTPASVNIAPGLAAPICVHVLRQDGFDGEIDVGLKDAPAGFTLDGGRIPRGKNCVRMTLSAPGRMSREPVALQLEGRAMIEHREVKHTAIPADDVMQAFLWRHLAPAEEFMATVKGNRRTGSAQVRLVDSGVVQIPEGGDVEVRVRAPKVPMLNTVELELNEPPEGVALEGLEAVPEGLGFVLKSDSEATSAGFTDNLIVEAFVERPVGKGATQKMQRFSVGVLPAIPFEIVTR